MTDQDKKICQLCDNVTDRFRICENCGRVVCFDCSSSTSGVMMEGSPLCSKCGSDRISVYYKGKKVP
jgi:RNA polymerase subunit RPABC4/transcription elongation factor Spt4